MKQNNLLLVMLLILVSGIVGADEITVRLESHIIETWDAPDSGYFSDTGEPIVWQARGSKYSVADRPRTAYANREWPEKLFGSMPDNADELGIFGINGAFNRQGYNQIEIIPGVMNGNDFEPKSIPLPGHVQTLDFWVWSGNYDYYSEVHFQDYRGIARVFLPFQNENLREPGSIKFIGWKNMFITMPDYIRRQVTRYQMDQAPLSLTKIVFTTHPEALVNDFYIYIDHLKVLSDMYGGFYDGSNLGNTERINEIWGGGE